MNASSVTSILLELEAAGLHVSTDGTSLTLSGPNGALTPDLRARVIGSKRSILQRLAPRLVATAVQCSDSAVSHVAHGLQAEQNPGDSVEGCRSHDVSSGGACVTCGAEASPEAAPAAACVVTPHTPIAVDFETRAPVSLDQVGGRAYARHPGMDVLCAVFVLPDGTFLEWIPGDAPPQAAFDLIERGTAVMAHNAHGFDRFVWERLGWPEATWIDSLPLARLRALPGNLDALAEAVLDVRKDAEGRGVTLALGRVDRSGRFPQISPAKRAAVLKYCRMDTLLVRKLWDATLAQALFIEPQVRELDVLINERGFAFDADLAHAIIRCEAKLADEARSAARVDASVLRSPMKLMRILKEGGVDLPNVRREGLLGLLDDPDLPDDLRAIAAARLASSGIASHKLRAALRRLDPDGRLRDTLSYHQAHTGRWAGRGFQPQNLPKGASFRTEADVGRAVDAMLREDLAAIHHIAAELETTAHGVCASLVRACVHAPRGGLLGVVDYAQVEARALLWMAGDDTALQRLREGVCPYRAMAAHMFGTEIVAVDDKKHRPLGKALVLGCGYQMGAPRFELYAEAFDIDWAVLGITPEAAVEAWRAAHPAVAGWPKLVNGRVVREGGLWRAMQDAAERAARGATTKLGSLVWERRGSDVVCILPSKRPLVYRNVRLELRRTPWGKDVWTFTYEHRGQRVSTYGGKLTENVTQAVCRDLLADALLRLERAGKRTVLHVHDEVVAEIDDPSEVEEIEALMCRVPTWAAGLPLKATGHWGTRYRK